MRDNLFLSTLINQFLSIQLELANARQLIKKKRIYEYSNTQGQYNYTKKKPNRKDEVRVTPEPV